MKFKDNFENPEREKQKKFFMMDKKFYLEKDNLTILKTTLERKFTFSRKLCYFYEK